MRIICLLTLTTTAGVDLSSVEFAEEEDAVAAGVLDLSRWSRKADELVSSGESDPGAPPRSLLSS